MVKLTRTDKAAVVGLGRISESAARIIVAVVLSWALTKTVYGTYQQVWLVFFFCLPFLQSDLRGAVFYFWPKAGVEGRKELVLQNLFLHAASGLLFFAVLFPAAPLFARAFHNESLVIPLRVFSLFPLLTLPSFTAEPVLLNAQRPVLVALAGFANRVIPFAICVIGLVAFRWSLTATFAAVVVGAALLLAVTTWVTLRQVAGFPFRWRWRGVIDQLKFAIPIGTSPIVAGFIRRFGQVVVAVYYDAAKYAVFFNGAFELPVFAILTLSATAVVLPEMSAHATAGRVDQMMAVWKRAVMKVAFFLLPATVFLFTYGPELILVLFSSKFRESIPIFLIMLFLLPTRIANFISPLAITKKSSAVVWGSLIALVSIVSLSFGLVHLLGLAGPAIASVLTRWIWTAYFIVAIHRLLGVPYGKLLPWKYIGRVIAVSLFSAGVSLVAKISDVALIARVVQWLALPQVRGGYEFWIMLIRFLAGGVIFSGVFVSLALLTGIFPALERERLRKLGMAVLGFLRRLSSRILRLLGRRQGD